MTIRRYKSGEEEELWKLYYDTTHRINGQDYTKEQVERWAPANPDILEWKERLRHKNPFVAEDNGQIVGFAELDPDGHIDRFYCHHQQQRKGIGTLLYQAVESEARGLRIHLLQAEVSTTAKLFFLRMGFETDREQNNLVCGTVATNFKMQKRL